MLPFECQDFEPDADPSGQVGVTTFCTNNADSVPVSGAVVSQKALPPYSLTDPLPPPESCTVSSVTSPAWWITGFETTSNATVAAAGGSKSIRFGVELRTGTAQPNDTDTLTWVSKDGAANATAAGWYQCDLAGGNYGFGPSNCTLRYDNTTSLLTLNAEWSCSDLDPAHPYVLISYISRESGRPPRQREPRQREHYMPVPLPYTCTQADSSDRVLFTGVTNTTVPALSCSTSGELTDCTLPDGTSWAASITSVSWHASEKTG